MFIFFTFWGLFSSLLGAISKDFANLVKSFVTAVLWLSGILWNPETIKIAWAKKDTYVKSGYIFNKWF